MRVKRSNFHKRREAHLPIPGQKIIMPYLEEVTRIKLGDGVKNKPVNNVSLYNVMKTNAAMKFGFASWKLFKGKCKAGRGGGGGRGPERSTRRVRIHQDAQVGLLVVVGEGGRPLTFRHNPGRQKSPVNSQAIQPRSLLPGVQRRRPFAAVSHHCCGFVVGLLWVCCGFVPPSTPSAAAAVEDGTIRLIREK